MRSGPTASPLNHEAEPSTLRLAVSLGIVVFVLEMMDVLQEDVRLPRREVRWPEQGDFSCLTQGGVVKANTTTVPEKGRAALPEIGQRKGSVPLAR